MIARIRDLRSRVPFQPFVVHANGDRRYRVPKAAHVHVNPRGTLVNIWFENDGGAFLSEAHITGVEVES